ncbi:MAG: DMT family transporter [Proteobacteria bacterium]|jgi:drug/metabolite transporter (DMT)-like permease|nr:DMT family transporter [Pseudomonadota bacterium]MDC1020278.1 DMT family transporter [Alphaproteobacteria bacterium]
MNISQQNNSLALMIMALSMFLLSVGDAVVRFLGQAVPVGQLIAVRGIILIAILMVMMRIMRDPMQLPLLANRWAVLRGLAETLSTYCFFISIQMIPIAVSTTVVFIFPVLLTLVSIPLFGEKVGVIRLSAVVIGFLGVVVVAAPSGDGFNMAMIYPIITAISLVVRDLATRKITSDVSSVSVILTTAMVTTLGGLASLPWGWTVIETELYGVFVIAAGLVACSFIAYVMAIRLGELSVIAPTQYMVILWATIWGALIWHEIPGKQAIIGGSLIILAGLIILWREHTQSVKRPASALPLE